MRRKLSTASFGLLLGIWGLTPLTLLVMLLFKPEPMLAPPWLLVLTILWSAASIVLLSVMLHGPAPPSTDHLMGLTCTLVMGLPALVFSSLPVFGSPADLLQTLRPKGNIVSLPELKENDAKTLYVVGIDVSESFLKGPNDPRLKMVLETFDSLFAPLPVDSFAASLDKDDALHVYAFASEHRHISKIDDGVMQMTEEVPQLRARVGEILASSMNRRSTDIVAFLTRVVCPEMRDSNSSFTNIKVVVFSDWMQSYPQGEEIPIPEQKMRVQTFQACAKDHPKASFLSFLAKAQDGSDSKQRDMDKDIARQLRYNLGERQWQDLELEEYYRSSFEERPTLPTMIYSNAPPVPGNLYLKYLPDPGWQSIPSEIALPGALRSENLFIAFRPLTPEVSPIRVQLTPRAKEDFIIGLNDRDRAGRIATENGPVQLRLAQRPLSLRDSRIEMLIAAPRCSTVYRVPVVVLPVLRQDAVLVFIFVIGMIHLVPVVLALRIFRHRDSYLPGEREPQATAAVPAL